MSGPILQLLLSPDPHHVLQGLELLNAVDEPDYALSLLDGTISKRGRLVLNGPLRKAKMSALVAMDVLSSAPENHPQVTQLRAELRRVTVHDLTQAMVPILLRAANALQLEHLELISPKVPLPSPMPHLKSLGVHDGFFKTLDELNLPQNLRRLALSSSYIRDLKGCPRDLKQLVLGQQFFLTTLEGAPGGLQQLRLRACYAVKEITALSSCTTLTHLSLNNSRITGIEPIRDHPSLQELIVGPIPGPILDLAMPRLSTLILIGAHEDDLSFLQGCPTLHKLELRQGEFQSLHGIPPGLTTLDIRRIEWKPAFFSTICQLKELRRIDGHAPRIQAALDAARVDSETRTRLQGLLPNR